MYRNNVNSAIVVDLGSNAVQVSAPVTGEYKNVTYTDGVAKPHVCKSFLTNTNNDSYSGTGGYCSVLPALGRKDNVSVSFSGSFSYWIANSGSYNSETDGEYANIQCRPFIARVNQAIGASPDFNHPDLTNFVYLPWISKNANVCSIDATIIVCDLGYGHNVEDYGIAVGYQITSNGSVAARLRNCRGSINCRYNFAPIKTIDLEL